jgi:hypothetical protein
MTRPWASLGTAGTGFPSLAFKPSHSGICRVRPWPKLTVTEIAFRDGICSTISVVPASLVVPPPKGGCVGALQGRRTSRKEYPA